MTFWASFVDQVQTRMELYKRETRWRSEYRKTCCIWERLINEYKSFYKKAFMYSCEKKPQKGISLYDRHETDDGLKHLNSGRIFKSNQNTLKNQPVGTAPPCWRNGALQPQLVIGRRVDVNTTETAGNQSKTLQLVLFFSVVFSVWLLFEEWTKHTSYCDTHPHAEVLELNTFFLVKWRDFRVTVACNTDGIRRRGGRSHRLCNHRLLWDPWGQNGEALPELRHRLDPSRGL